MFQLPTWNTNPSPVSEGDDPTITYDVHACSVTVKVTDKGDGKLNAEVTYPENTTYTNVVLTPAEGEIKVTKKLTGRNWKDGDGFTFTIEADEYKPEASAVPVDDNGDPVTEVKAKSADAVSFGKITFTKAGGYKYVVRETEGDLKHVTYDTEDHVVTNNVEDDGNGGLVAKEGSSLKPTVEVENVYTPAEPDFNLKVKDTNDSTGETSDWQDSADYDEGDEVPFKVDVTLPDDGAVFTNKKTKKPTTPTNPNKPTTPTRSTLAKTSDLASPLLPQLTMLGSALLGGGVVLKRRKRRRD